MCMAKINSFRDIIRLWPTRADFAKAIGVKYTTAQQMDRRDAINIRHFSRVVAAASLIQHPEVTHGKLMQLAERKDEAA